MNKQCTNCKQDKPLEEFYDNELGKDGKMSQCKCCVRVRAKTYQQSSSYRQSKKRYYEANKDKHKIWKKTWDRKAMQDPLHRLSNNVRGNMHHALKAKKAGRSWETLVGYSVEELIKHLEQQFTEGISWETYGIVWHVDHVIPKSWFKYENAEDPKFKECWALKNLQPKLKMDNIRKGNRYVG